MSGESNSSYLRENSELGLGVESTKWCQHLGAEAERSETLKDSQHPHPTVT